ncbi:MAG: isoprenylcysteine carboxylmethyltransferase family protein [Anaerolineales bacterium]
MTEIFFRIIQGLLFAGFVIHRAYFTRKFPPPEEETTDIQGKTLANHFADILTLPALFGVLLYVFFPAAMAWANLSLPDWVRILGILIALGGFALLQWSHVALGRNWSDQPRLTRSQTLVTTGPYRSVRHPIYTAFLMILGSTLLVSANWFIGGLWLLATGIDVRSRIKFEEDKMLAKFGAAYKTYLERTGSLLPRL